MAIVVENASQGGLPVHYFQFSGSGIQFYQSKCYEPAVSTLKPWLMKRNQLLFASLCIVSTIPALNHLANCPDLEPARQITNEGLVDSGNS
jgi:hypothetical protein